MVTPTTTRVEVIWPKTPRCTPTLTPRKSSHCSPLSALTRCHPFPPPTKAEIARTWNSVQRELFRESGSPAEIFFFSWSKFELCELLVARGYEIRGERSVSQQRLVSEMAVLFEKEIKAGIYPKKPEVVRVCVGGLVHRQFDAHGVFTDSMHCVSLLTKM